MLGVAVTIAATPGCGSSGPAAGTEGGDCYGNGTCNAGLVCLSDHCVDLGDLPDAGVPDAAASSMCTVPPCDDVVAVVPTKINRDLDLLFVVDNSGSFDNEQASLQANFSGFINVLANIEGGLPNLHIGVVSTDVGAGPFNISGCSGQGDNGILQNAPRNAGCSPPAGQFISDIGNPDGTRITNYTGDLADVFGCVVRLGIDGCGFEQPLESMLRALDGRNAQNAGFLRPDALLGVVLLSDEDDCSTEDTQMFDTSQNSIDDPLGPLSSFRCFDFGVVCDPDNPRTTGAKAGCRPREDSAYMYPVQRYIDFLRGLKSDPFDVIVAGIIGNPDPVVVGADMNGNPRLDPSCMSASGTADPGIRLQSFLEGFPGRRTISTICNEDLSDALTVIAELLRSAIGVPCLSGPITLPLDCTVEDVQLLGQPSEERTELPPCDNPGNPNSSSNLPCYTIQPDLATCPDTETQLALYTYPEDRVTPNGTQVVVTCKVDEVP